MSGRRPLADMLVDVASGAMEALTLAPEMRIRQFTCVLPVELELNRANKDIQLLGDLPRLLTRTSFDLKPGRIEIVWEEKS